MARQITDLDRLLGNQISDEDLLLVRDYSDKQDKHMSVADLKTALNIADALSTPSLNGRFIISKTDQGVTFEPYIEPEFTFYSSVKLAGKQYAEIPLSEFKGKYDRVKVSITFNSATSAGGAQWLGLGHRVAPSNGVKLVYRVYREFRGGSSGASVGDIDTFPIPVVGLGNLIEMVLGVASRNGNIPCQGYSANGTDGREWHIGLRWSSIAAASNSVYFGGNSLYNHPGSPAVNFSDDAIMNIYVGRKL